MHQRSCRGLGCGLALVLGLVGGAARSQTSEFKVVVNATNPISSISKERLSQLFMKKITRWDNGTEVFPVDLTEAAPVRLRFSRDIFGREAATIRGHWQRQIFSGRSTPPPELASEEEILDYVRSTPGAIGYVAVGTNVGSGVKVVPLIEPGS